MATGEFKTLKCGVVGAVAIEARSRHTYPKHIHDEFGVGMLVHGAQRSLSGRGMVEAQAGDVITVNPGEVHDGISIGGTQRSWRMLFFDARLIARAVADISEGKATAGEFTLPVVRSPHLGLRFRTLYACMTGHAAQAISLQRDEALLHLVAALVEHPSAPHANTAPAAIRIARSMIDDNPGAALGLEDLAQACGLSHFQLVRGFAKAVGMTPHAYLLQRRLNLARRLIGTGRPLADAALDSGFSDQSHMTRQFVRSFGISPGVYAQGLR